MPAAFITFPYHTSDETSIIPNMVHQASFFQCPQIIPVTCANTARAFHFPNLICHLFLVYLLSI